MNRNKGILICTAFLSALAAAAVLWGCQTTQPSETPPVTDEPVETTAPAPTEAPTALSLASMKQSKVVAGDYLDLTQLTFLLTYPDGSEKKLPGTKCDYSKTHFPEAGEQVIEAEYEGLRADFTVFVDELRIDHIKLASLPAKIIYHRGDRMDLSGLTLIAYYNNGRTEEKITEGFTADRTVLNDPGRNPVVISYQGFTTELEVYVNCNRTPDLSVQAGDVITFGPYEWVVLEQDGEKALLITKEIVAAKLFNRVLQPSDQSSFVPWETCTLREWLNVDFLKEFDDADLKRILKTVVVTPRETPISDRVFLLSVEEAERFFGTPELRIGKWSEKAIKMVSRRDVYYEFWLLRNGVVERDGSINPHIENFGTSGGVRPVLWIDLGS